MKEKENKSKRLSDVLQVVTQPGANDGKWMLIEHQLCQAKMSSQIALEAIRDVVECPENDSEADIASDCHAIIWDLVLDVLEHYSTFLHYISGTDVSGRVAQMEV